MKRTGLMAIVRGLFPIENMLTLGMDVLPFYICHFLHEEKQPRQAKC